MIKYDALPGTTISHCANEAVELANKNNQPVTFEFNGINCESLPGGDPVAIADTYMKAMQAAHDAPEAVAAREESQKRYEAKKIIQDEALRVALAHCGPLTVKDPDGWAEMVKKNNDPYGSGVMRYAETWGRLMEAKIAMGVPIAECADELSNMADTEGVTGFMHGCAASALAKFWTHGEDFRRWFNRSTQLGTEGDRANETGGILNPAVLVVGYPTP